MTAPIVFFDIAGPDLQAQAAFYRAVFHWDAGPAGAVGIPSIVPLPDTLRADPAGNRLGLAEVDETGRPEVP